MAESRLARQAMAVFASCGMVGLALGARCPQPMTSPESRGGVLDAVEALAERSGDPERTRGTLLWRLRHSSTCYAPDLTPAEYERLVEQTGLWPLTWTRPGGSGGGPQTRYFTDSKVWTGPAQIGDKGLATRASLTYSFPDDGVMWGFSSVGGFAGTNVLNAKLTTAYGSVDRGREYIRAAMAAWRRSSGLTYAEVADDNQPMDMQGRVNTRGDIRIGGFDFAAMTNGVLAYNAFPTNLSVSDIGGADMVINSSYFIGSAYTLPTADFLYFRNTVAHEHGHGLGFIHSIPCDGTKLMEPSITLGPTTLSLDEIRGAGRNYGDRYAGNNSRVNAAELGNLTAPLRSIILRDLSTNVGGGNFGNEDYFEFTIDSPQTVTLTVQPTGVASTMQGQQTGNGCNGVPAPINTLAAGNLNLQLITPSGAVIAVAPGQPAGASETLTVTGLSPGTYIASIVNITTAAVASPNQFVQTYDLTVRIGGAGAIPEAIAGLHKRVRAAAPAFFNGSANSRATDAGAGLNETGYEWDLDGDGAFEIGGVSKPTITYASNGAIPVTLRLTDTAGMSATDQITVTVFGATTSIASVSPASATPGQTVPVTIFGANFKGVTLASQVSVSGTGVTVGGTPSTNLAGTQITGLSFTITGGATQIARDVTITNSDGLGSNGTGVGVFTVGLPGQPPANDECGGALAWSGTGSFSFNNANATTGTQQSFPSTGCPTTGPIFNDVWYLWTSPTRGTLTANTDSAAFGFQTRLAMYRNAACPPTSTVLRCDDLGSAFTVSVNTGSQYLFQVGSVTSGATGAANVILSLAASQGACCALGACTVTGEGACLAGNGEWTFAATCSPTFCPQSSGACCITGSCFINTPAECAAIGAGAVWSGPDTTCGTTGNPTTCCPANFNMVNGLGVQDLFDFLLAWFAGTPAADFNGVNGVGIQDLFDYLVAYFSGCSG